MKQTPHILPPENTKTPVTNTNFQHGIAGPGFALPNSWWWMVTAVAVALVLGLGFLDAIRLLGRPLALFIFGGAIAASLAPAIAWLARWLPRNLAVIVIYTVLFFIIGGIGWLIIQPLVNQATLLSERLPDLLDRFQQWFSRWNSGSGSQTLLDVATSQLGTLGGRLVSIPLVISNAIFEIVLIIFISLYALLIAPGMRQFTLSLLPPARQETAGEVLDNMAGAMGGYVRGVFINGLIIGVTTYVGLLIIGVQFPLILALLAAILELIPYLGPLIAGMAMVAVALLHSTTRAFIVLAFVLVLQQVESNLLTPNVMRHQTHVPPLLVLLALVGGHAVGGVVGALAAIPVTAALRVVVVQVIAPQVRQWTGATDIPC